MGLTLISKIDVTYMWETSVAKHRAPPLSARSMTIG